MTKAYLQKLRCEKGATAIEYGLIVAAISVSILALVFMFGDTLEGTFNTIHSYLSS
jgi:Flp pilus assembly pilin Flp